MKNCIYCGAEISDDAKFCGKCGSKQERPTKYCIHCGAEIPADFVYCEICGKSQTDTEAEHLSKTVSVETPPRKSELVKPVVNRKKLSPYVIFTLIVQLAIIVLMLFDFEVIKVRRTTYILGEEFSVDDKYGVNIIDLFHFTDTLGEFIPDIRSLSDAGSDIGQIPKIKDTADSIVIYGVILAIPVVVSILFYIIYIVGVIKNKSTQYSLLGSLMPFLFFITVLCSPLCSLVSHLCYIIDASFLEENLFFGYLLAPILVLILGIAQFIANLCIKKKKNKIFIFCFTILIVCFMLFIYIDKLN